MMYKFFKISILIFLLGMLLFGCKDELTGNSSNFGEIIPLNEGNSWHYIVNNYDSLGNLLNYFSLIDTVLSDTIFDNTKWYKSSSSTDYNVYSLSRNQPFYGLLTYDQLNHKESLVLKYPCKQGDSTEFNIVISTNIEITFNSAIFKCIQYRQFIKFKNDSYVDFFVAPGVGILNIKYSDNQKLLQEFVLKKYKLKL